MTSRRWRDGQGRQGIGTILLIASALLMVVPFVGATRLPAPSPASEPFVPSALVKSGTSCVVGTGPEYATYDPVNHDVYVPNYGSGTLSVLSGSCKVVATVTFSTGAEPVAAGFDPTHNWVYVTDHHLNEVYVLSGTKLVHTIMSSQFDGPYGVVFDPGDAEMAVANRLSNTVTFLSGTTVRSTVTVGSGPFLFGYDPYLGRFLVTNFASHNVTSLNAEHPTNEADNINIPVGTDPTALAFDPADHHDYVADRGSSNVTVIDGVGHQYGSVSVGSEPEGLVWDQAALRVEVANYGSSNLSVIQGLKVAGTLTGPVGSGFNGIAYDEATGQVFVPANLTGTVYIYGTSVPSAGPVANGSSCAPGNSFPYLPAYDPVNHDVYVPNGGSSNLSILSGACKVVATINFSSNAHPVSAAFDPTNNEVYVTDNFYGQVYVISGTKVVHTITNSTFDEPTGAAFDPGDGDMAISNNGGDTVTFISGTTVVGSTIVGLGPFQFAYDPHYGRFLVTDEFGHNVTSMNAEHPTDEKDDITIPVGSYPEGIAFDYANSEDYVVDTGSGEMSNVTVITGIGGQVGSVPVGSQPVGGVWDQAKLSVYVDNGGSPYVGDGSISVIQEQRVVRTIPGPSAAGFYGVTYDEAADEVFVTGEYTETVYVYN